MSLVDYLTSPIGIELTHAIILLLVAVAAYISYRARVYAKQNAQLLNSHLEEHIRSAAGEKQPSDAPRPGEGSL